ncbi:TetR/AcrR family transcriptional regulator [Methylobacterium sp. E-066]|uniref:TetR/AcrR family transcriptional regulator n=1 Tax=Methylobacterium sp. E-066 TaxID=2836584 RepID=UPI001FB89867|nr:TetR/AcrR family transcriptional regulator [Methylobacterium sp. E-066]MCJ2139856.1 TetR/AcrR family transcriptional regulator [Methylobacterium sp. E-066]
MERIAGPKGLRTAAAIRRAGLKLIYRHGFGAMSLRDLASEVGIQASSLYNHIRTKQDLLFDLIREHMDALLAQTDAALAAVPDTATERLRAFIRHHIVYHLEKKQDVFIANFELRSLEPQHYATIVAMRRAYESKLIAVLDSGVAEGAFDIRDTRITAYSILAMLTGVCTWYKPEGRLTKSEIVELHTNLVLHGCVAHCDDARS